jgi:hypothetical protein
VKKTYCLIGCIVICLALASPFAITASEGMIKLFPKLEGWSNKGKVDIYTPDNLYEYINGAADVFLSYDFVECGTLTFENKQKKSFTVDIYRHSNIKNGFGIYSQEKPQQGEFIDIGTQGYYEKGVLNFLKGSYYVKISGFDLGDQDKVLLTKAAKQIAANLKDADYFPKSVSSLPQKGKVEHSERYIAKNFLGHSFLHSSFVADYESNGEKFQVFIMETESKELTRKILEAYLNFLKKKQMTVEKFDNESGYRFSDPYYRSSGKMNLKIQDRFIWGLFSKNQSLAEFYLKETEKNLVKK